MKGFSIRSSIALAAVALTSCVTADPAGDARVGQVRLATWNLEHLAEANGQGCRPRDDADYAALRDHADRLAADVVAFQEVENAAAAARVFPAARWAIVMSQRPDSGRRSPCGGASGSQILKQDVGFAVRKGVRFRRNPDVEALGLGDPDLRWGVDITLGTPKPLRLLAVHLKSGCNVGRDLTDTDCPVLFAQAPVLERWIDERAQAHDDFAVLGDWNRRTALRVDEFLAVVSDDDPPAGRLVFADQGHRAACVARYPDYIDHIAFGHDTARRVVPGSFGEYSYEVAEDKYPSDHCPSYVSIGTGDTR